MHEGIIVGSSEIFFHTVKTRIPFLYEIRQSLRRCDRDAVFGIFRKVEVFKGDHGIGKKIRSCEQDDKKYPALRPQKEQQQKRRKKAGR